MQLALTVHFPSKLSAVVLGLLLLGLVFGLSTRLPTPAGAQSQDPDLDVTFIERTPRFARNCTDQNVLVSCDPNTYPDPEDEPHWPEEDSEVTFIGHIKNKGSETSDGGYYEWWLDEGTGAAKVDDGPIPSVDAPTDPNDDVTVSYNTTWDWDPATTHEWPQLELRIFPSGDDAYESNDQLTYYVLGKSVLMMVEDVFYDEADGYENLTGTYSYEDWFQAQVSDMNERLADSVYDGAPSGSLEGVNVEEFFVYENPSLGSVFVYWDSITGESHLTFDGWWANVEQSDPNWLLGVIDEIDDGTIHELAHGALSAIDTYNIPFQATRPCSHLIMGGNQSGGDCLDLFEPAHVLYFNQRLAYRNGVVSEFLLETPSTNTLELKDSGDQPLVNAEVIIYQRLPNNNGEVSAVAYGRSDANGEMTLPNRPSDPITTATGFSRGSTNPFGNIAFSGQGASHEVSSGRTNESWWLSLRVVPEDGTTNAPYIFDITWANAEAMAGNDDAVYTLDLPLSTAENGTSPPAFTSLTVEDGDEDWLRDVTASVSGASRVDFYVDGRLAYSDDSGPFEYAWDMSYEKPGKHWLSARAVNSSGDYTLSPLPSGSLVDGQDYSVEALFAAADIAALWGENLTANEGVTAKADLEGSPVSAPALIDGNLATESGSSHVGEGDYWEIDLGDEHEVAGVRIVDPGPQCLGLDIYATEEALPDPLAPGTSPVASRSYLGADNQLPTSHSTRDFAFPATSAQIVTVVCHGSPDRWARVNEIEVYGPPPAVDLTIETIYGDTRGWPDHPDQGAIEHRVVVTNQGGGQANATSLSVYQSDDDEIDGGDTPIDTFEVNHLTPGQSQVFTYESDVTWTKDDAPGRLRYFLAEVDAEDDVPGEEDETNNIGARTVGVSLLRGDVDGNGVVESQEVYVDDLNLVQAVFSASPSSVRWNPDADFNGNGKIAIGDILDVAGQTESLAEDLRGYLWEEVRESPVSAMAGEELTFVYEAHYEDYDLSVEFDWDGDGEDYEDPEIDGTDYVLGEIVHTYTEPGTYTPKMKSIGSDEEEHVALGPTVTVEAADLVITGMFGDTRAWPPDDDDEITHRVVVKNEGVLAADPNTLTVYRSTSTSLEDVEAEITSLEITESLDPGEEIVLSYSDTVTWTKAQGRQRYYIAVVDSEEEVLENSDENNTASRAVGVSGLPYDVVGEGLVSVSSILAVSVADGTTSTDTAWNPDLDINASGDISPDDYEIVSGHVFDHAERVELHVVSVSPTSGTTPLEVTFEYTAHYYEGSTGVTSIEFDFENDGGAHDHTISVSGEVVSGSYVHTYGPGTFTPKVFAYDDGTGSDSVTGPTITVEALDRPESFTMSPSSSTQASFSWEDVDNIDTFEVCRATQPDPAPSGWTCEDVGDGTSATLTLPTTSTTAAYYYAVRAIDAESNAGKFSNRAALTLVNQNGYHSYHTVYKDVANLKHVNGFNQNTTSRWLAFSNNTSSEDIKAEVSTNSKWDTADQEWDEADYATIYGPLVRSIESPNSSLSPQNSIWISTWCLGSELGYYCQ